MRPFWSRSKYLRRLFLDVEFSHLVVMAAQLGVADLLASGPRSVGDLAAVTGVDATSLERVLRALASRGLFSDDGDKRFSLTPLAEPLRRDAAWPTVSGPASPPSITFMANPSLST
jgi:hypothetical protein